MSYYHWLGRESDGSLNSVSCTYYAPPGFKWIWRDDKTKEDCRARFVDSKEPFLGFPRIPTA